jgi:hypothetical protein
MPIDTRDKRGSVVGVTLPVPRVEQNPSATIAQAGRQLAAFCYIGILAAAGANYTGPNILTVVEMEFAGFGNGWTDVSTDVTVDPIQIEYGMGSSAVTDRVAPTGTMKFGLDNSKTNSVRKEGYYSPNHVNLRTGFGLGIRVRCSIILNVSGSKSVWYKFLGTLDEIAPTAGIFEDHVTRCTGVDFMDDAARWITTGLTVHQNIRSDQAFRAIVAAMPRQPNALEVDVGLDTYPYALDNVNDESTRALEEFRKLALSELGYIYVKGGLNIAGILTFEARSRRPKATSVLDTYADANMLTLEAIRSRSYSVNKIQVTTHPRRVDPSGIVQASPAPTTSSATLNVTGAMATGQQIAWLRPASPIVQASPAPTSTSATVNSAAGLNVGAVLVWKSGSQVRGGSVVTSIVGNALTWSPPFASPPASGDTLQTNLTQGVATLSTIAGLNVTWTPAFASAPLAGDLLAVVVQLFALQAPLQIPPGTPTTILAPFHEPLTKISRVGGLNMLQPVAVTDFKANTAQNGTGTDVTASFTVSASYAGNAARLTITNNSAQTAWVTALQLRGQGVYDFEPAVLEKVDAATVALIGQNAVQIDMPYQHNPDVGVEASSYLVNLYKNPLTQLQKVSLFAPNTNPSNIQRLVRREISDRVAVTEIVTGIPTSINYFINGIKLSIDERNDVSATFILAPADNTKYWLLEIPGQSELESTTILGYGLVVGHGDVQHVDLHQDSAHQDSHTDSHTDTPHGDVGHSDSAHTDVSHSDSHTDVAHSDVGHSDSAHSDVGHQDTHQDVPHSDTHSDQAHADDAHQDNAHSDIGHQDVAHQDVGHQDTPHVDDHTDFTDFQ